MKNRLEELKKITKIVGFRKKGYHKQMYNTFDIYTSEVIDWRGNYRHFTFSCLDSVALAIYEHRTTEVFETYGRFLISQTSPLTIDGEDCGRIVGTIDEHNNRYNDTYYFDITGQEYDVEVSGGRVHLTTI